MIGFSFPTQSRGRHAPIFPFPALLLDLCVTTARAKVVTEDVRGPSWTLDLDLTGFSSATDVVGHLMEQLSADRPRSLLIALPGPVLGFRAAFTNSDWIVDCLEISRRFLFDNGILLNDLEAAAFSVPDLGTNEVIHVGSRPLPFGSGPETLIALRTGLGAASLRRFEQKYVSIASEAGHIGLSPSNAEELDILGPYVREHGRLNAEHFLFDPGLGFIHDARLKVQGAAPVGLAAEAVVAGALADPDSEEAASARLFARMIANYAGDLAAAFFSTGGVTIAGPILRTLAPFFQHPSIRQAFERRAPLDQMLHKTAFRLALIDDLTVRGLTVLAQNPSYFAINFENRCWREADL